MSTLLKNCSEKYEDRWDVCVTGYSKGVHVKERTVQDEVIKVLLSDGWFNSCLKNHI